METLKVLVVDDEPGMRLGVARALRDFVARLPDVHGEAFDANYEVAQAPTGEDALEMLGDDPLDILLLDHKLPGISGLDVLERIAGGDDAPLTIMITAYASLDAAITATKRGAFDFLAKPFTPDELRGAVRKATRHLLAQRQARRLAEEKRQVRFQFISVLAHELKAPIAAIEGYLRILRDGTVGDDPAVENRMLDRSMTRLDGMRKLIADLLDLTRIESGQKKRELAEVDVADVADAAIESFAPAAAERDITVSRHGDAPATMRADRGEVEIILNNLVSNAVKYNRDGGRVDVTISAGDERVTVTVADTGIGMKPGDAERLFGDFVRIKNDKTRNIDGSGLGLSIVRKLALLYGGDATVDSEPDVGSTFTVTLQRDAGSGESAETDEDHDRQAEHPEPAAG